jgi:hypothetical protein
MSSSGTVTQVAEVERVLASFTDEQAVLLRLTQAVKVASDVASSCSVPQDEHFYGKQLSAASDDAIRRRSAALSGLSDSIANALPHAGTTIGRFVRRSYRHKVPPSLRFSSSRRNTRTPRVPLGSRGVPEIGCFIRRTPLRIPDPARVCGCDVHQ